MSDIMRAPITVVFCDIVGVSIRDEEIQKAIIGELNREVTYVLYPHLHEVSARTEVICLPAGDGMAVVFVDHGSIPWKPTVLSLVDRLVHWSLQRRNSDEGFRGIRIGVHAGNALIVPDINRRRNVCGDTVNECQRVMDAAHADQVLLSAAAYSKYFKDQDSYSEPPFSREQPARVKGPYTVIAKHDIPINVHIVYRQGNNEWNIQEPYPRGPITDKKARTKFIVNRLEDLSERAQPGVVILEQSALSSFAVIEDKKVWRDAAEFDPKYTDLVILQKTKLRTLVENGTVGLRVMVNPILSADPLIDQRVQTLVAWLKHDSILHNENVDIAVGEFQGPNRLIVGNNFYIDGYKMSAVSGYDLSVVHHDKEKVKEAVRVFMERFSKAKSEGQTKQYVIEYLAKILKRDRI